MNSPAPRIATREEYEQHVADMITSDPITQRAIRRTSLFDVACDGHLALVGPERRGCMGFAGRSKQEQQ